jgi:hypothetical protein
MKKVAGVLSLCLFAMPIFYPRLVTPEQSVPGLEIPPSTQRLLLGGGITLGKCEDVGRCTDPGEDEFTGCCGETEEECELCDGAIANIRQNELCKEFASQGNPCDVDQPRRKHEPCFDLMWCDWVPYPFPPGGECQAKVSSSHGYWWYCVRVS